MTDPVFVELSTSPPAEDPAPAQGIPAPTITFGGPSAYPVAVAERLAEQAAPIIGRYPQARSARQKKNKK